MIMDHYIRGFFVKCLENMASAKMWMFLLPFIVSSVFMGIFLGFSIEMVRESLKAAGVTPADMTAIPRAIPGVGSKIKTKPR